ncbi:MAG: LysE family transporter [Hydrotalea flava]|uniref:LysE family translocator n=1 Tax=Hydrotalea TaxID=1004300 RepID=UPI00094591F3|nr:MULTISPECIES: LysE family translocator [Hydrotalea]MBY0348451.1 LysE family translocator [Hydrotalea flava]NIM34678.1 LysE family transporter [Hydrotalea flava]NIM37513.1 LysE family transporter [Hydrotalea flava]NIN02495.1 LysE family transporter [Hydrotalea flava]NIN14356.1 LysE family transporter [Hydrotalea flava]
MIAPFLKGLVLGIMLAISVGPVIFSIIKQSINNGHKGGFTFVAGVSASDITLVLISQLFTELFRYLLDFKKEIGIGGSMLLIAIGIFVLFFKKVKINEDGSQMIAMSKRDYVKTFFSGYFMNTLNPGVIGFWLVIATSVVDLSRGYRIIMFSTCLLFVLSTDIAKVLLAGKLRQKLTPHNIHLINKISGLILIGFGLALIWGTLEFSNRF